MSAKKSKPDAKDRVGDGKGKHRRSTLPSSADADAEAANIWQSPSLSSVDDLVDVETLVLMLAEDVRPLRGAAGFVDWRLCGQLSQLLLDGVASGTRGENVLFPAGPNLPVGRILLVGCGASSELRDTFASTLEQLNSTLDGLRSSAVAIAPPEPGHALQKQLEVWASRRSDVSKLFSAVGKVKA